MSRKPQVALIIETSSIYGRGILRGINRYLRSHQAWTVFLEQRELTSKPPDWLHGWNGDGVISRSTTSDLAQLVASAGIPMVELTDRFGPTDLPHIRSDDRLIGEMAFDHLSGRGFCQFGFCGYSREHWSQVRGAGFSDAVRRNGGSFAGYESPWYGSDVAPWEQELQRLGDWLLERSRPVGILACNDIRGKEVLDACGRRGLAVPEEVAVIGVDNDELLCQLCDPPLSSVISAPETVGYQAAAWLDRLMHGQPSKREQQLVAPLGITTRQSTDILAIDDADVVAALRQIRQFACDGLTVSDVLQTVPLSRSILERRFRKHLGRSPQAVIRETQIKRVQQLLSETELSLAQISQLAGYKHVEHMCVVFKREVGQTPGQYRRQIQPQG
jgi:LacI family transcriptional regulator